jgi:Fe-S-cluster containining protein
MRRDSPFSYECRRCNRCCRDKIIKLNPYEVARLARSRGMDTTTFIERHTTAGGTVLRFGEDGACVFLTPEGCGVHPDRPLVCRLYPLGRHVRSGRETFSRIPPEPGCEGVPGKRGTVAGFLEKQGAPPLVEVVDRYLHLVGRMVAALQAKIGGKPAAAARVRKACVAPVGAVAPVPGRLDMDPVVERYCREKGLPVPPDLPARTALHFKAIEEWIENL